MPDQTPPLIEQPESRTHASYTTSKYRPDEVYNLAAQSHVKVSFEMPQYTGEVDGLVRAKIVDKNTAMGLT